jgi:hypothetical protein
VNNNHLESKENCDEIEVQIDNDLKNNAISPTMDAYGDYLFGVNDKFQDSLNANSASDEKSPNAVISDDIPMVVNSITDIKTPMGYTPNRKPQKSGKKHKKKRPQNQIDYEDEDDFGTGFSTMIPSAS